MSASANSGGVRFAPSPTGNFHVGNLRTAWVSREWARRLHLPWVVRFEDIDRPRNVAGARERQLEDMAALGLTPDAMQTQSDRASRHWEVFRKFHAGGLIYPCDCSRKNVRESIESAASAPHAPVSGYTGRCRPKKAGAAPSHPLKSDLPSLAWRIRCDAASGRDDFVIARTSTALDSGFLPEPASFVPAYHWACAIDDADGGYDLLVRAWDLEEATGQQRFIQRKLCELEGRSFHPSAVFHASLVLNRDGGRLEKRSRGATLPELFEAGETSESLIRKFEKSFTGDWSAYRAGLIFGEESRTLPAAFLDK